MRCPTVSVVIPTYNEEQHLAATLESVLRQTYPEIVDVVVADGRSTDATRDVARGFRGVTVIDNPARIQAAGLNRALDVASGEIVVRVDGHCILADDYVERCVETLTETAASMVGGAMVPTASDPVQRGIACAMGSRLGAGPARFHVGGAASWVDTVYLGAFRRADALALGGYAEDVGVNEDAEFAHRMQRRGGIRYEPAIRSTYVPRADVRSVARQFYRYGASRAATVRRHPRALKPRQLAAPLLALAFASPWRGRAAALYATVVVAAVVAHRHQEPRAAVAHAAAMPAMHFSWGLGFVLGLITGAPRANVPRSNETS